MKKLIALLPVILLAACSMNTPPYQASMKNVQTLKSADAQAVQVGEFSAEKGLDKISLRGNKMTSHVGKSYGEYLKAALTDELKLAELWAPASRTIIEGTLLTNDINVAGFVTGNGEISARFVVSTDGKQTFDKTISASNEFDSSFMGAIAIPNAQASYVDLVQTLLNNLFSDPEFIEAIR